MQCQQRRRQCFSSGFHRFDVAGLPGCEHVFEAYIRVVDIGEPFQAVVGLANQQIFESGRVDGAADNATENAVGGVMAMAMAALCHGFR